MERRCRPDEKVSSSLIVRNASAPEDSDGSGVLGAGNGTVFDDSFINRQKQNNDLTTFMLKKTWFYSPFMLKKFERTTFHNAKKSRKK